MGPDQRPREGREEEVKGADVLVVGGEQPARHEAGLVVVVVVFTITLFADFHTAIRALNSFDSDSLLLWCLKHICAQNQHALIDLDFYLQTYSNRGHYHNDAFRSDPNEYLYYHIAFDEFAYELLRKNQQAMY